MKCHILGRKKENEAGLGSDMSVPCFKKGKSDSISGTDFEILEHRVYLKNIIFPQTNTLVLSSLSVFKHPECFGSFTDSEK